jgi:hypothetical protein
VAEIESTIDDVVMTMLALRSACPVRATRFCCAVRNA